MTAKKSIHTRKLPPKRKKSPAKKMAGVTLHKADTSKIKPEMDKDMKAGKRHRVSSGAGRIPYDCPVYIEVERAMGPFNHKTAGESKGLYGHVITINPFTKRGVGQIQLKLYRDPNSLKLTVGGEEVFKWTEDPNDMPTAFGEFAKRDSEIGGMWADHLKLESDDEVIEKDDGTINVKRGTRRKAKPKPVVEEVDEGDIEWE